MVSFADRLPKSVDDVTRLWCRTEGDYRAIIDGGCRFDLAAAEDVRDFLGTFCIQSKGQWADQPIDLIEWQWLDIVGPLYGWRRPDGCRRYRRGYIEVPKKQGKSTLCAGLALYHLVGDGEAGPLVAIAAYDQDQAGVIFDECAEMVRRSASLTKRLKVIDTKKRIVWPKVAGVLRALSREAPQKEGANLSALFFDELHVQKTPEMWNALRDAGASRRQPVFLSITTAGHDRNSICWEQHCYAEGVFEGTIDDPAFLAVIYAAAPTDDPWATETWRKANPSLGITVTLESMEDDARQAKLSRREENNFRRRRLNQWTESEVRWLDLERWDACPGPRPESALAGLTAEALEGRRPWAGLDLANTIDLVALAMAFPWDLRVEEVDRIRQDGQEQGLSGREIKKRLRDARAAIGEGYDVRWRFWCPEGAASRRAKEHRARFDRWIAEGWITTTPGELVDYEVVKRDIFEEADRCGGFVELGLDPWNATQVGNQIEQEGMKVIQVRQGYRSLSEPSKRLEGLVLAGRIDHGANPVARWMAGNVSIEMDAAGNIKPSRDASKEKIDGIVALVIALARAISLEGVPKESKYEDEDLLII